MIDLCAFVDSGVFDLAEISDMDIFGQFCAGAQAGEGADGRATADVAALEMGKCADAHAALNRNIRAEDDIRFDNAVASDDGVMGKEYGIGGRKGHTIFEGFGTGAGLKCGFGVCQLCAAVDAHGFGFVTHDGSCSQTARIGDGDDVGEIIFTRGIVIADCVDQGKEGLCLGADHTGIAQGYCALFRACIFEFDDRL